MKLLYHPDTALTVCSDKLIPCEGEGLKPIVGGVCVGVAETDRVTGSSAFYFSNDMFDAVPISMALISKIEAVAATGIFQ